MLEAIGTVSEIQRKGLAVIDAQLKQLIYPNRGDGLSGRRPTSRKQGSTMSKISDDNAKIAEAQHKRKLAAQARRNNIKARAMKELDPYHGGGTEPSQNEAE
jgi:hypothetical protein